MGFSKVIKSAAVGAALLAAPATAAPADGRLYFATIVSPSVKLFLDGRLLDEVGSGKWQAFDVAPGPHSLRVVHQEGSADEKQVNFDPAQLADAKGGRWWCAVSVVSQGTNAVRLIIMDRPACKNFVDQGN